MLIPFGAGFGSAVDTGIWLGGVLHLVKSRVKAADRVPVEALAPVDVPEALLLVVLLLLLLLSDATRNNVTAAAAVSGSNQRLALANVLMRLTLLSLGTSMAMG